MTTSEVARLIPRPPALVDNKKRKFSFPSLLKASMEASRSLPPAFPSTRYRETSNNLPEFLAASSSNLETRVNQTRIENT